MKNMDIEYIDHRLQQISEQIALLQKQQKQLQLQRYELLQNQPCLMEKQHFTVEQKLALFSERFVGRSDVFAYRWENNAGKAGYAVACGHEWRAGVCFKPRVKCSNCQHRQLLPLDNKILYAHLTGKRTVGIYPLLPGDMCRFLVADFDKSDWKEAVTAFSQSSQELGVSCLVERSRSGHGAHVWIFFSEPVLAKRARLMGFGLLDRAMERYPGLEFESYDRLFPNQDHMPAGGFGNLIALPLQHGPRQQGHSTFINADFNIIADPWLALLQVRVMSGTDVQSVIDQLGCEHMTNVPEAFEVPWEVRLPSTKGKIVGCPRQVELVLANMVHILMDALPSQLLAQLKRLATFSNPQFFKTQAMRFSTTGIPRHICCARMEGKYLSLPRGCLLAALTLFKDQAIEVLVRDERVPGDQLTEICLAGELRDDQVQAVNQMVEQDIGILYAPTAFGKTITAIGMIAKRQVNTLILVHNKELVLQWKERLETFLINAKIGVVYGGKIKPTGQIDVATYQSLLDRTSNTIKPFVFEYGHIIVDECHHLSAPRYELLLSELAPRYVLGLTATPQRQDGHQPIIFMQAGPIIYRAKAKDQPDFRKTLYQRNIHASVPESLLNKENKPHISAVFRWLVEDTTRTQRIVLDIASSIKAGHCPIVLTERRNHAQDIELRLNALGYCTSTLRGGMKASMIKAEKNRLHHADVVIATGRYVGEGFDLPRLDTLFLALPISWKGTLAQYVGRIHRACEGKREVQVFDYVDVDHPMLKRMFHRRAKGYIAMGYDLKQPTDAQELSVQIDLDDTF